MVVIEEASNMLLIEDESGISQIANSPRNRIKHGAGSIDPTPELFERTADDNPITINDGAVSIYSTQNQSVFVTLFDNGAAPPIATQNSIDSTNEFLKAVETLLQDKDVGKFKKVFNGMKKEPTSPENPVRPNFMESWFDEVTGIEVVDEGLNINNEIILYWDGEAVLKDKEPTRLIVEFYPHITFMDNPSFEPQWSREIQPSNAELFLIQRATHLYDDLQLQENTSEFKTKIVKLLSEQNIE